MSDRFVAYILRGHQVMLSHFVGRLQQGITVTPTAQELTDLGNLAGGGFSSWLIARRGWPVPRARKLVVILGGLGMTLLAGAAWAESFAALVALFAISTFSYAALSTMILTLPADLFPSRAVATVSGMSGFAAGVGTILTTFLIGAVADRYSFAPVLVAASLVPLAAIAVVLWLIDANNA